MILLAGTMEGEDHGVGLLAVVILRNVDDVGDFFPLLVGEGLGDEAVSGLSSAEVSAYQAKLNPIKATTFNVRTLISFLPIQRQPPTWRFQTTVDGFG